MPLLTVFLPVSVYLPFFTYDVFVSDSKAYVADGEGGFIIMPLPVEVTPISVNSETSISVTLPSPLLADHYTLRVFNETENSELFGAVSFTDDPTELDQTHYGIGFYGMYYRQ